MTDRQKAWVRARLLTEHTSDKVPMTKVGDHGRGEINPKHINTPSSHGDALRDTDGMTKMMDT